MMVHFENALLTNRAMVGSFGFEGLAFLAVVQIVIVESLLQIIIIFLCVLLEKVFRFFFS